MRKTSVVSLAMFGILAILLAGCPPETQDDKAAVQKAAVVCEALDLMKSAASDTLTDESAGVLDSAKDIGFDVGVEHTVDFDAMGPGEIDLCPTAMGQIRIECTAAFALQTGGCTITVDPLRITCLTDVVVTDPHTGATATFAAGGYIEYGVAGSCTGPFPEFHSQLTFTGVLSGYEVTVQLPDEEPAVATADIDSTAAYLYDDENFLMLPPGVKWYQFDDTRTITWNDGDGQESVTIVTHVDTTTVPPEYDIDVTVNGVKYGPYTPEEFEAEYGQEILTTVETETE